MDLAFLDAAQRAAAAAGLAQQTCGDAPATAPAPLNPFPDETFESPGHELFACCECGETRAALVLLEAGADARWVNRNEESCVSAAAGAGAVEIIRPERPPTGVPASLCCVFNCVGTLKKTVSSTDVLHRVVDKQARSRGTEPTSTLPTSGT